MTYTSYEAAARHLIAELDRNDRDSTEYLDAMQALSILSSIRDSGAMGYCIARPGRLTYVAADSVSIAAFDTLAEAREYVRDGEERTRHAGHAIVLADRRQPETLFTRYALTPEPLPTPAGGIVRAILAELDR